MKYRNKNRALTALAALALLVSLLLTGCNQSAESHPSFALDQIPAFSDQPYVELDNNQPSFTKEDLTTEPFEEYAPLDLLGRCGPAYANICREIMPTEERGEIGQVKPSGWHTVKYDNVDGKYLYNRCHLVGFQLAGENANQLNLITGTRYLNVTGMLPFENEVAEYVKETDNHVLYRVTPIFHEDELVARGVQMEALSVEDEGKGVCFNVYVYNNQPGVTIDYATGESWLEGEKQPTQQEKQEQVYVLNTKTKRFHLPDCAGVKSMSADNRQDYSGSRDDLISQGYAPCGQCKP